ncbi:hypothetical protein FRB98_007252 [Tulasnella sp. 332]|nr:hypothetical protein FRB98_007252 [Tulasnella sp. 332]
MYSESVVACPFEWHGGLQGMYAALIACGATRQMAITFQRTFTHKEGIVGWADDVLHEQFSGPGMKQDDQWRILLGRPIRLDRDSLDGSISIKELLEDAVVGPVGSEHLMWKTTREVLPNDRTTQPNLVSRSLTNESEDKDDASLTVSQHETAEHKRWELGAADPVLHFDNNEPSKVLKDNIANEPKPISVDSNVPEDGDDEYPGYDVDDDRAAGRKKLGPIVHAHHEGHNVAEDAEMHDADHIDSSELGSDWDSNEEFGDDQRILAVGRKWLHEQDERARQNM